MKEEAINRTLGFFEMCDCYNGWNRHHNEFPLSWLQTSLYRHNYKHCSMCRKKIDIAKIGGYEVLTELGWKVESGTHQVCPDCTEE